MILIKVFLWLITYSVMGWVYEFAICSIQNMRLVNPGFLIGPLCPIYGFGALLSILILYRKSYNIAVLFVSGMLLTCTVEFVASVLLEKVFSTKWWDYSQQSFNLQGRVCLLGALAFGILTVLLIKYIHPFISGLIDRLPNKVLIACAIFLFLAISYDLFISAHHHLNRFS